MKKLLILLVSFISYFGHAQTTSFGNFKIEHQEIIFQKVYTQDSITLPLLEAYYKTLPFIANVTASENGIQFEMNNLIIDYKKFQFTQVGTPTIIQSGLYSGKVTVGAKEGKYRVTLQSIQLTGDIGYKKITTKDNLTNYACRNSGTILSQDWCRPNMLGLLDQAFADKLQYAGKKKSDW